MSKKTTGKRAFGFSDRSSFRYPLEDLVPQIVNRRDSGLRVGKDELDEDHPQWQLGTINAAESIGLKNPRLDKGLEASREVYLPRISVSGKRFIRSGLPYKFWGWHSGIDLEENSNALLDFSDPAIRPYIDDETAGYRRMGTNIMRLFLQLWSFVEGPDKDNLSVQQASIDGFLYFLDAARRNGIYIKVCGANVWIPSDAPAWFDALTDYRDRWDVQEFFYTELVTAIVNAGHASTVMGYDLTGEPVTKTDPDYPWYGEESYPGNPEVGGQYYNPCIARGPDVTNQTPRDWIIQLSTAIKAVDPFALCTVGTLPFIGGAFGLTNTQDILDFVSPHIYPNGADAFGVTAEEYAIAWTASTVPVICGEFIAFSTSTLNRAVMNQIVGGMQGMISWGDGRTPDEIIIPPDGTYEEQLAAALLQYYWNFFVSYRDVFFAGQDLGLVAFWPESVGYTIVLPEV